MDEKIAEKRLVSFNKECILAGPRQSVVSFLKMLMNLGADVTKATSAKSLITSKSNIVLLLKNEGKSKKFPHITVLSRSWWDYYHNPKKHRSSYKTYNIPKQWNKVYNEILKLENIPFLIPE